MMTPDPVIAARLTTLSRRYNRINNWLWACNDAANGGPVPNVRRMPSKALKAWAYDDLAAIVAVTGVTIPADFVGNLNGINYVLTAFGKRPRPVAPLARAKAVA
jgi:hypothetical protein